MDDVIERPEGLLKETQYEVIGKAIADLEELYEEDKQELNDKIEELDGELKDKEKEIDALENKVLPYVSVALCEDGDYTGQFLGLFADNLRDQDRLDNLMRLLYTKGNTQDEIQMYKLLL